MLSRLFLFLTLICAARAASDVEVYPFKRLVVADSEATVLAVQIDQASPKDLYLTNVPALEAPEFKTVLAGYLQKPISAELVTSLADDIAQFGRKNGVILNVTIPNQNVSDGTVRLIVTVGHPDQTAFLQKLGIAPGTEVRLARVAIGDTEASASAVPVALNKPETLYVQNVPLVDTPDFRAIVARYVGKPISAELVVALAEEISTYARAHDRLIANVSVPPQNAAEGTLRLIVAIGRFNQLAFSGNKWFSAKLLNETLGIKPGDEIRLSVLEDAVSWANTNPFRQLKVVVNPIKDQPGKADLIIGVQEAAPWRFALSGDNYGNKVLGQRRYTGSVQFGNLWGLDHRGMYQFVTTDHLSQYQVHAFEYRIPTPARHFFEIRGVYSRVSVPIREVFTQKGENKNLDLRYTIPLQRGTNPIEVWAGLDLKRGNNNLEYVGYGRTYESAADTVQLATGISYVRRDKYGAWALGGTLNMSPGGITGRNDKATYTQARYGSTPRYVYGTVSAQRQQTLKAGWELSSKLIAQISSANLLGSEQLPIGGPSSVRGADTNVLAGDEGFTFSTDLLSPAWSVGLDKISKRAGTLDSRFVVFYDAGQVFYHKGYWFDPAMRPLASVGAGVRMSVSNNLSLVFDYGWLVTKRPNPSAARSRGTLKVTLAY